MAARVNARDDEPVFGESCSEQVARPRQTDEAVVLPELEGKEHPLRTALIVGFFIADIVVQTWALTDWSPSDQGTAGSSARAATGGTAPSLPPGEPARLPAQCLALDRCAPAASSATFVPSIPTLPSVPPRPVTPAPPSVDVGQQRGGSPFAPGPADPSGSWPTARR